MIQIKPLHQQYFLILLLVTLLGFSSILIFGAGTRRKNGARVSLERSLLPRAWYET